MTLCIVINGYDGIVLAAESRTSALLDSQAFGRMHVPRDDAAEKLFRFKPPNTAVGVVIHGTGAIDEKPVSRFMPDFEATLPEQRLSVQDFAQRLSDFFMQQWQTMMPADYKGPDTSFVVAGFDPGLSKSKVLSFDIPGKREVIKKTVDIQGQRAEIYWGGQYGFIERLIRGLGQGLLEEISQHCDFQLEQNQPLLEALKKQEIHIIAGKLQEYKDLAIFLIQVTIDAQRILTPWNISCGGPIDVATITRYEHFKFIQRKQVDEV